MSPRGHGQFRRSQVVTTYGPGSLIDLPNDSAIVGGLDTWPHPTKLDEIQEPRLTARLQVATGVPHPKLYAPPPEPDSPWEPMRAIGAHRFPGWYLVQEFQSQGERQKARRLVPARALDNRKFEGQPVVPIRFVRGCRKGHIDDIDWRRFIHGDESTCRRPLWLVEQGTGDLGDLRVRCECGESRLLWEAKDLSGNPLGSCRGARPWLGNFANEPCGEPSRLLTRTASNAYFPQLHSVLSLPNRASKVESVVRELWDDLQIVKDAAGLAFMKQKPSVAQLLAGFDDAEVLKTIDALRKGSSEDRPLKVVELDAILAAPEGYGDDVPVDPNFHARRLPDAAWRRTDLSSGVEAVIQLHRLREVIALSGFTRFEAITRDINGEYDSDVHPAAIALDPSWFPAIENRGEGLFLQLRPGAVAAWLGRPDVQARLRRLAEGHEHWREVRKARMDFPGGPYILLHTMAHLMIQSVSMHCGYPASSIRERIYVDAGLGRFGILLYTASPDAEGTLGGLVAQGRHVEAHLAHALRLGALCSNDPICAQHHPGESLEERWLHGAACHGCTLISETSCEMRNDYLDRALVVPVVGLAGAAFFQVQP